MQRARRGTARTRALAYLTDLIRRSYQDRRPRLPTITELARLAGVGRDTMWRAVMVLRDEGRLITRHRSGILVTGTDEEPRRMAYEPAETAPKPQLRWQRLRAQIVGDILKGAYPPNSALPATKQLVYRYGACHRTLRKALLGAVDDGYAVADRGGYRVAPPPQGTSRNCLVLVCRGESSTILPFRHPPRNVEVLRALEQECTRANVHLVAVPYAFKAGVLRDPAGRRKLVLEGGIRDSVLGFLLWTQGLQTMNLPQFTLDLCSYGRPVAVLDDNGFANWYAAAIPSHLTRVFALGLSARCGAAVGRHLLQLGHRRVAYLGPGREDPRYQGLRQAFRDASVDHRITPLFPDRPASSGAVGSFSIEALRLGLLGTAPPAGSTALPLDRVYRQLCERMRQTARRRDITAWVAMNDVTGLICLQFLRQAGVRVPQQLSLVAFDDTTEACVHGLSSYNFSIPAIAHSMVWHVIHPPSTRGPKGPLQVEEMEGFVTNRSSSAPVAAGSGPSDAAR